MSSAPANATFSHIKNDELRDIIHQSLKDMKVLLENTPCLSALSLADQLNEIKKAAFEKMYEIGRQSTERDLSEEVLKAIRALQDAFAQIIGAVAPMDNVRFCLNEIWLQELEA